MKKRASQSLGFTLIEVAIVLSILAIATFPFLAMADQLQSQYQRAFAISDLKTDCVGALSRLSTSGPVAIDQDQRGANLPQGKLRWEDDTLTLTHNGYKQVLLSGVRHASLFRRGDTVYLTLEVSSPQAGAYRYRTRTELGGQS